jgi:pilus assembly protein Flp/PilA
MKSSAIKLYAAMQVLKDGLVRDESGQDLIEYALVVALIALGATAAMSTVATAISTAFAHVGSHLATYTT